jgi:acetyl-CoA carboxylase biotin carboxyl carrier protein
VRDRADRIACPTPGHVITMDRERVRELVALLKSSTSMELAVREGDSYIRVRRAPVAVAHAPQRPAAAGAAAETGGAGPATDDLIVRARLVGRFYRGKGPGKPPLVNVGDKVAAEDVVATIEALGKLTGVPCPEAGDVVEVLAEDGQAVAYGAPLLRVKRG